MRVLSRMLVVVLLALVAGCAAKSVVTGQRVSIHVTENGFEPAVVNVKAGQPVTLLVTRTTDQTCATELVMKEQHIHQSLPLNHEVAIKFTPSRTGDLTYACGMDMYRGKIHVE